MPRSSRSIWRGAISFGIVSIPVRLFTATEDKDISFRQLHVSDHSRIRYARYCAAEDIEVPTDEIVRGYEYEKDRYVVLDDEDFEHLPLPSKQTISLTAFVNAAEIDATYYEKSYYLEPEDVGVKPFALLMRALTEKGLTAVAKIAIRNKERLCALRPMDGMLMLETLYYPDELRVERGVPMPDVEISEQELAMASALIDLLTTTFQPEQYEDHYREALLEVIRAKLEGQQVVEAPEPAAASNVVDLMAALRASVEATKREREQAPAAAPTSAAASAGDEAEEAPRPARRRKAAS
ncbi:MAG: Ku protein [Dehalococcoidia bacterium]